MRGREFDRRECCYERALTHVHPSFHERCRIATANHRTDLTKQRSVAALICDVSPVTVGLFESLCRTPVSLELCSTQAEPLMPGHTAPGDTHERETTLVLCAAVSLCTYPQQAVHAAHGGRENHQTQRRKGDRNLLLRTNCEWQLWGHNSKPKVCLTLEHFRGDDDVVFGDVTLLKNHVRQACSVNLEPRQWQVAHDPLLQPRYRMQQQCTPEEDQPGHVPRTRSKMKYMQQYVKEQGDTPLCNVNRAEKGTTTLDQDQGEVPQ